MKAVLSSAQMREAEKACFDRGISSLTLMERAAKGLAHSIMRELGAERKTCVFACGPGGNGGDGYAAARIFTQSGGRAILLPVVPAKTPDAVYNYRLARECVFGVARPEELDALPTPDAWADCMFGIGLSRAPEGPFARVIDRINADRRKGALVVSADIASGLNADTGECPGKCVRADVTVAFQAKKRGHLIGRGLEFSGRTVVSDIGIPDSYIPNDAARLAETADFLKALPYRPRDAHKNVFGHLLIIAGSFGMAGAASLCANAAMRTGAGLVSIACPASVVPILQTLAPCAMCIPLPETDGAINADGAARIERALSGKTAVAIGPGLSLRAHPGCVEAVLKSGLPAVIDADGLNILSRSESLRALLSNRHAITPHPGEAARLLGNARPDPFETAQRLRKMGCNVLLKGATSIICGSRVTLSASGTAGMAKGGSGDALTGIVASFLAQGLDAETALWLGSELHGRAGEIAAKEYGERSMLPTDLVSCIGRAFEGI